MRVVLLVTNLQYGAHQPIRRTLVRKPTQKCDEDGYFLADTLRLVGRIPIRRYGFTIMMFTSTEPR